MIKDQTLDEAIVEAMRFVKAAKALRAKRKEAEREENLKRDGAHWRLDRHCTVEHAACKRASMDLTRKMADLRAGR